MTSTPPPNGWQPNGNAAGQKLGGAAQTASGVFAGAAAGIAGQRHWEATEDLGITAVAAARAAIRWMLFFWTVFVFLGYAVASLLAFVGVFLLPLDTGTGIDPLSACALLGGPIFTIFAFPYGLGVLWMRFSDRSLFRVNHTRIYRIIAPFAHRVRNLPDIVLWMSPAILWGVGTLVGTLIGAVLSLLG